MKQMLLSENIYVEDKIDQCVWLLQSVVRAFSDILQCQFF